MSKAEDYIQENTRDGSNKFGGGQHDDEYVSPYYYWLTPDQARKAVRIAKEEIYKWLEEKLPTYMDYQHRGVGESAEEFINDLKQAMKDE